MCFHFALQYCTTGRPTGGNRGAVRLSTFLTYTDTDLFLSILAFSCLNFNAICEGRNTVLRFYISDKSVKNNNICSCQQKEKKKSNIFGRLFTVRIVNESVIVVRFV